MLRSWLQLLRIPTVFTAIADICAGFLLTHRAVEPVGEFALLILASSCLYLAGMVLNDVFDRKVDAVERPERPIPSGRISARAATEFAVALLVAGNICAWCVGANSLKVSLMLTAAIVLYDAILKKTPLGPLAMGTCRFLNVILGASAIGFWVSIWTRPQLLVAIGLGVYVIGLTWFARREAATSQRWQLIGAAVIANLGVAILAFLVRSWPSGAQTLNGIFLALGAVALAINVRMFLAIARPEPPRVQAAVVSMLLSIVMLDAIMVYFKTGSVTLAAATALLIVPVFALRPLVRMT